VRTSRMAFHARDWRRTSMWSWPGPQHVRGYVIPTRRLDVGAQFAYGLQSKAWWQMSATDALGAISDLKADFARIRDRMREVGGCKDLSKTDCVEMLNGLVSEMTALNKEWKDLLHRAIYSEFPVDPIVQPEVPKC
jgi:hypothetical protein